MATTISKTESIMALSTNIPATEHVAAIQIIYKCIIQDFDALSIILFGSMARSDHGKYSDIDIMVVMPEGTNTSVVHYSIANTIILWHARQRRMAATTVVAASIANTIILWHARQGLYVTCRFVTQGLMVTAIFLLPDGFGHRCGYNSDNTVNTGDKITSARFRTKNGILGGIELYGNHKLKYAFGHTDDAKSGSILLEIALDDIQSAIENDSGKTPYKSTCVQSPPTGDRKGAQVCKVWSGIEPKHIN